MVQQVYDPAYRGFFKLAGSGYAFTFVDRIREHYGSTLEQNYPEASKVFLRFATTYWTFKLLVGDTIGARSVTLTELARTLEMDIASVFFPTPGPVQISPAVREQKQRELLGQFQVDFDIEDFIRGNPILARDRVRQARSGCLGVTLTLGLVFTFLMAVVRF